jgi:HopA1 effector protein family
MAIDAGEDERLMPDLLPENDMAARLDALLGNVEILSGGQFRVADGPILDVAKFAAMPRASKNGAFGDPVLPLRDALSTAVYICGYSRIYGGGSCSFAQWERVLQQDAVFLADLAAANPTLTGWEPGWKVFQLEAHGAVHVQKGDRALLAQPGMFALPAGSGRAAQVGDFVELLIARDSLAQQAGRYFAFGQTIGGDYDFARIARLYFNAPSEQAAWLLTTIGGLFNRYFVPYRFKCSVDPKAFDCADSVVFYLARRFLPAALRLLLPLADELDSRLRRGTPLFSKPLLNGLGVADDPGTGESFGQTRSCLIADGIVDAWLAGSIDLARRREAVAARFSRSRLSMKDSHLRPGLVDLYTWPTAGTA